MRAVWLEEEEDVVEIELLLLMSGDAAAAAIDEGRRTAAQQVHMTLEFDRNICSIYFIICFSEFLIFSPFLTFVSVHCFNNTKKRESKEDSFFSLSHISSTSFFNESQH